MTPPPDRPDAKLIPIRGGPIHAPTTRDPRIDVFRGLALVMIIVTHMPGNPWESVTIRTIGFSDAAEAFFVMSGIAAGIAYSPGIARWLAGEGRAWDGIAPMWRRAWTLYMVQTVLTVAALGLFAWAASTFYRGEFRVMHNLARFYEDPGAAMWGMATLGYQIGYVNILPAYIALMLLAPLILVGGMRAPRLTLALGLGLWLVAGIYRLNVPNHPGGGGWFFSPFAWQAIFMIGLLIGIRHRNGQRLVPVNWPLFGVALAFLFFVFAWRHVPDLGAALNRRMAQLGSMGAPYNVVSHSKTYLALPRFLHVMALVYVISCLPFVTRACASRWADPLRRLGRHGLLVFALGTMLALTGQIVMDIEPNVAWLPWVVPPLGVALAYLAAWIADRARPRPGGAPRPRAIPTPDHRVTQVRASSDAS
ncbi:OpgC family protein [Palleronia abyssalis]|uniref:OpgC protein n=1 Tax=Palleronia abyssalis TaxID=1501240 RepID=A0A2R8BXN6_9RHOB|nr:OpgC domain-containing protein [Palleronia abyssalis]SPJ24910.1 hypothetical protein PAA8504_02751 [Palleronia abyssalis]